MRIEKRIERLRVVAVMIDSSFVRCKCQGICFFVLRIQGEISVQVKA